MHYKSNQWGRAVYNRRNWSNLFCIRHISAKAITETKPVCMNPTGDTCFIKRAKPVKHPCPIKSNGRSTDTLGENKSCKEYHRWS